MRVKLTGYVRRNGVRHKPDSFLDLSDADAERLIRLGVAAPVAPPSPPKPPPTPDDPESLAAASVRDLAEVLPRVEDSAVLELALEAEKGKEVPRSTVVEMLEKRLAELTGGGEE